MREVPIKFAFAFLALIMLTTPSFLSYSVSAEDEVDNWPESDAWLHIELVSWSANQTVEWDNDDGPPDPHFQICIEADGDNIDCINTQTWENQLTLNNSWNYSIDIPDYSNILNITIECKDNDAINDDECDMNSELDEWKLYAQYNWSANPTLTVIGNGSGDGDETWKNAASEWRFTIGGYGDEDFDGVEDSIDNCPSTSLGSAVDSNGCDATQRDSDNDGVSDAQDNWPEEDAWLYINLISWSANQTVEWDNNEGFPDPHFQICIEADGDNIDCINTPTWDDQLTLNNPWNYPIDLPDYSNILNITIECGDNDALNDDECDMNSELEEWKLYAQYNWSQTPTLTLIGNGDGDGYGTWKNAASEWRLTIGGYVDEDFDGVEDSIDNCPSTDIQYTVDEHGCSLSQKDSDNDGVTDADDICPATKLGSAVDSDGCDATQRDSDNDGVTDADDNCPATNLGSTVDSDGCDATQRDSDFDGIVDSKDECSNTPNGIAVDENGCDFREGSDSSTNSDDSREGSSDSSSGFSSGIFCSLLIIGIVVVVIRLGAKNKPGQHRVHTPPSRQQHIPIQRQPSQQEIQAQMLHQKQIEAQHLQNQLAQQASQTQYLQQQLAKQSRSASEMKGMQEELAQLQESKAALEQELEETSKATTVVQNITYNIQDSAISGDLNANLNPKEE
jgi:hypothetical protein|tara:strand:- start:122 stop:2152 length:2031 start_codon:yes stop_codon:yes gene_type:complete